MPLTIYTLQILLLALVSALAEMSPWVPDYPGWPLLVGLALCSLLFAMLWHRFFGAGPLERLLRWLSGFDRRARKNSALTDWSSHT